MARKVEDVLPVEPETEMFEEVPVVEPAPEAEVVFDAEKAQEWLHEASNRLVGVFKSVRFEPEGIEPEHINFVLLMACRSILGEYKFPREKGIGVLFVPKAFADRPVMEELERCDEHGEYVAFHRKLG